MTRAEWYDAYRVARHYRLNTVSNWTDYADDLRAAIRAMDWLRQPDPLALPAFTKVTIARADGTQTSQWMRNKR